MRKAIMSKNKPDARPQGSPPAGSEPKGKTERENERVRDEAQRDSGGDAPIDPADEGFIESSQK